MCEKTREWTVLYLQENPGVDGIVYVKKPGSGRDYMYKKTREWTVLYVQENPGVDGIVYVLLYQQLSE